MLPGGGSRISHHLRECDLHFRSGINSLHCGWRFSYYSAQIVQLSFPWPLKSTWGCISIPETQTRMSSSSSSSSTCSRSPGEFPPLFDSFSRREDEREIISEELSPVAGGIVALGKFDALHIGHRELAIQASRAGPPFLLSFAGMAEVLGWEQSNEFSGNVENSVGLLLNQGSSHVIATGGTAEKGNFPTGFHVTSNSSRYWIVDSGASDHMSVDSGMFSSWYPYTQNYKVRIADGSLADVTGIGEVSLSDSITLKSDVDSGKMIGNARVCNDLYRFEMNKEIAPNKQSFTAGMIGDSLKEDRDIMFCDAEPSPILDIPESEKELKVYSRRKKDSQAGGDEEAGQEVVDETRAEIEDPMHCQDTPSDPHSHEKGTTTPNLAISDVCPDEILSPPIAKRKGVRTCTLHPITQFVSYEKLSPKFPAFVSNLDKEAFKSSLENIFAPCNLSNSSEMAGIGNLSSTVALFKAWAPIVAKCDRKRVLSSWAPYCSNMVPEEFQVEFSSVRHLSPRQFVEKLSKELRVRGVVAGENYRFGYKAAGDASELVKLCEEYGMEAYIINSVMDKNRYSANLSSSNPKEKGQVSSTRVRQALAVGDMRYVSELLGRQHRLVLMATALEGFSVGPYKISAPKSCLLNLAPKEGLYKKCYLFLDHEKIVQCSVVIDTEFVHVETDDIRLSDNFGTQNLQFLHIEFADSSS
ncbi:FAD synthetase 1, chloroplastic-like [Senna tora]|uniref:FAD synthase n=1 Tax=Senna tora TaxID=362788 RepID=A0A834T303_9FABA|nr:FAD synthetase 1, chloroplastic-like [Senna tora]